MEIIHISAECYPVAKVGGLADVVGALPKYQKKLGHTTKVVLPAYENSFFTENEFETIHIGNIKLGLFQFPYTIFKEKTDKLGFELFQIEIIGLFDRPNMYSYDDDTERFMAFQIACLNWITEKKITPDIIHCHDHHSGLIPFMVQNCTIYEKLKETPTIITIHNAQYQGGFGMDKIAYLPSFDVSRIGFLEWNGIINPLASAIKCAWKITTVSKSYLEEMSANANGLESLLCFEKPKSMGILNGIDTELWNPETDSMLESNYAIENYKIGKQKNKESLCKEFNLDAKKPLFAFIGRLVAEKGADLLVEMCQVALDNYPNQINILLLGSGDKQIEESLIKLKEKHTKNFNVYIGYNEKLAHNVYGGADFLLMPSRIEPCGLNQMYALRYGTVPIVRRTGGLKDSVIDFGDEGGFGICQDQTSIFDMMHSISRAIELNKNLEKQNEIIIKAMKINHSWDFVAQEYCTVYQSLKN